MPSFGRSPRLGRTSTPQRNRPSVCWSPAASRPPNDPPPARTVGLVLRHDAAEPLRRAYPGPCHDNRAVRRALEAEALRSDRNGMTFREDVADRHAEPDARRCLKGRTHDASRRRAAGSESASGAARRRVEATERREGGVRSLRRTQTAPERPSGDRPSPRPAMPQGSEESSTSGAASREPTDRMDAGRRRFATGDRSPLRRRRFIVCGGDRCGRFGHSIASSLAPGRALNGCGVRRRTTAVRPHTCR